MRIFKVCAIAAGMLCASQTTLAQTSLAFGYASEVSITGIEAKGAAGKTATEFFKGVCLSGFLPRTEFSIMRNGNTIVHDYEFMSTGITYTLWLTSYLVNDLMPGEPPVVKVGDEVLTLIDNSAVDKGEMWSWTYDFTVESMTVGEYREKYLAEHPDVKVCILYDGYLNCLADDVSSVDIESRPIRRVTWSSSDKKFMTEDIIF